MRWRLERQIGGRTGFWVVQEKFPDETPARVALELARHAEPDEQFRLTDVYS